MFFIFSLNKIFSGIAYDKDGNTKSDMAQQKLMGIRGQLRGMYSGVQRARGASYTTYILGRHLGGGGLSRL